MTTKDLNLLAILIQRERPALLSRWREQVRLLPSAQGLDIPTLNDHIPDLLDELAAAFRAKSDQSIPDALLEGSPPVHGFQRVVDAFDIEEVVAEYNILRGCIHDLADENGISLQGQPFHIINRVFDHAIGLALQTYATTKALEVQRRREEYLAFVAHDLRTPLNAISLVGRVLELTLQPQADRPELLQLLGTLRRNVQHLEALVCKVLEENTHLQTEVGVKLERREFDLWPLVESLIHDLHPIAGTDSTKLKNQVPSDLLIYADANLANAIKYTPRGEVVIGARALPAPGSVECWVKDNGAGIPQHFLDKIFDKGEADPSSTGVTGLGLAIVKTFVEAHGGEVTVESKLGIGACFKMTLPGRN
jgi:two-component system phosphate regulon sensor histidine kinase PhoR